MASFTNFADVKAGYTNLWNTAKIRPEHLAAVHSAASAMLTHRARYEALTPKVPWWFIAIIHNLEGGGSFSTHLHNGDPLTERTIHVPIGRPKTGEPPFTWEGSAFDALQMEGFLDETDWSFPKACWSFEKMNGFGYTKKGINSPYIWSYTTLYTKGKYVADGVFDADAVSQQIGAAAILKQFIAMGEVLDTPALPLATISTPAIPAPVPKPKETATAMSDLQNFIKQFSSIAPTLVALVSGQGAPLAVKVLAEVLNMDIKSDADTVHNAIDATAPSKVPDIIKAAETIAASLLPPAPAPTPIVAPGPAVAPSSAAVATAGVDAPVAPVSVPVTPVPTSVITPILTGFDALFPWLVGYKTGAGVVLAALAGALHYGGFFPTVFTDQMFTMTEAIAGGFAGVGLVQKIDRGMSLLAMFRSPAMVTVKA